MKKELLLSILILSVLVFGGCAPKQSQKQVYVSFFNESNNTGPKLITLGNNTALVDTTKNQTAEVTTNNQTTTEEQTTETNTNNQVGNNNQTTTEEQTTETNTNNQASTNTSLEGIPSNILVKKFTEGDLVSLQVKTLDPDNDQLVVTYSSPLNAKGQWQTKVGDAGQYKVKITVSDGQSTTSKDVLIDVEPKNKPPVVTIPDELTFNEGDTIVLKPQISDPEGDSLNVDYSGWMDSNTKVTNYDDAGTYLETITVSDGQNTVTKKIKIIVKNKDRAPIINIDSPVEVKETQPVELKPSVSDPDGDSVILSYSGIVDSNGKWNTTIGDAGTYKAVITATDGQLTSTKEVKIIVDALNRPPVIQRMQDITVYEGDTIVLKPTIIDPDGDSFSISYSGWMNSSSYTTNYNDAGNYIVTVTATDSKGASSSQEVKINVLNKNRPPEIIGIE